MKEIIYLDTNIMNSLLAQLDNGLISSFSLESSGQETEGETTSSTRGKNAGLSAALNVNTGMLPGGSARIGGTLGGSGTESEMYSKTILEGQRDILNKAFHDHALEVLISKLNQDNLLYESDVHQEGDLQLDESTFRFYDFDLIKRSMDYESLKPFMLADINSQGITYEEAKKIVAKTKPTAQEREKKETAQQIIYSYEKIQPILEIFKQINTFSSLASNLLKNLTVIKANNKIGLLKKEYLRESTESLSFRTDNKRSAKMLIRVIGKKEKVYNGNTVLDFSEDDLDKIPNTMLDVLLGSFNIIKNGDILVTPIAIYYE